MHVLKKDILYYDSLEPLAHRQNVTSLGITLVDFHLNWVNCEVGALTILIDRIIFLSPFLDATRISMFSKSFFPRTARIWNSLPIEFSTHRMLSFDL